MDTLWQVANMCPQPVTRMKHNDATSQHSERSHMKAEPKRDCCTPALGQGLLLITYFLCVPFMNHLVSLYMKIEINNFWQRLVRDACLSRANTVCEQTVNNS